MSAINKTLSFINLTKKNNYILSSGEKKDIACINFLAWVLSIGYFLIFVNDVMLQFFNIPNSAYFTFIVYAFTFLAFVYNIVKHKLVNGNNSVLYITILMFYCMNYLIFFESREYLISQKMLFIYFLYVPIAIFIILSIDDWKYTLAIFKKYAYLAVTLSFIGSNVIGYSENITYMMFSYSILPFVVILYAIARNNKDLLAILFFILGLSEIIIFGARAPILFILTFILLYEFSMFYAKKNLYKVKFIFGILIATFTILLFGKKINDWLFKVASESESRFLMTFANNALFESSGRNEIFDYADLALSNMELKVYGLFGDRIAISKYIFFDSYVHNIFYEFILSFGFIFGSIGICVLIYLIVRNTLFNEEKQKIVLLIFTCGLFLRYMVSGSFIIEGNFYLFIAILLNINRNRNRNRRNIKL